MLEYLRTAESHLDMMMDEWCVLLKKDVEEEDLSLREEVHVERSKCGGLEGRREGLVGRAEGLSIEKSRRIRSASFHFCCEGRQRRRPQQAVSGNLRSGMEGAVVVSLEDGNGKIELTPSSLELRQVNIRKSTQTERLIDRKSKS
jgi:hypothetical protein